MSTVLADSDASPSGDNVSLRCGKLLSRNHCVTHRTMKSAGNVLLPSLDCSRQAHRNHSVRRRPAVKLKELDHSTLERAFNLDTNIIAIRQRNSGAQFFADVDVTLDIQKRNGQPICNSVRV